MVFEPFLLKLLRQRWYAAGRQVSENRIKTYAIDRITDVTILSERFELPPDFEPERFFSHSFGIIVDQSRPRRVAIRADIRQAKYLRALPLHHTQKEMVHDDFSIFYYDIQLTPDFLNELLSMGPHISVLSPPELRAMVKTALNDTLALYD